MFGKYTIEDIAVLGEYRVQGKEVAVRVCPECGDGRYKFWVDPSKGVGYCYHCHYSPRLEQLLGAARLSGIGLVPTVKKAPGPTPVPVMVPAEELPSDSLGWEFIVRRRLDVDALIQNRVGYCPTGRYRYRLIFPFYSRAGEYRGFQGRWVLPHLPAGVPKWITASGTKKSQFLWNFHQVFAQQRWCVLVEGIFDALRIPDWGVAMLGKTTSAQQRALLEYFDYIFVMLDADATEDAKLLARTLVSNAVFRVAVVQLEEGDPDSNDPKHLAALLRAASPAGFEETAGSEVLCG
ncbi:hypothetical protein LCGC14_0461690 [marine sediment metagenome]|uniref:Toprim domain-containing protein n=1 Tax=marine sediment metagenome TaxID=412755 RepID=A0A0F9V1Q2_9ZZZZ